MKTVALQKNARGWNQACIYQTISIHRSPTQSRAELTASTLPWHIKKTLLCKEQETKANLSSDAFKASEELSGTGYYIMRTSLINWFDFETFSVTFYWSRQVPLRCKSNIPRGSVELHGKWAGVTLTVSFPHRQSAQIPFLVGKLVNTSTPHTSHFAVQKRGERGVKWEIENNKSVSCRHQLLSSRIHLNALCFLPVGIWYVNLSTFSFI